MNRIVIGSYEFTDDSISENPQKYISNSMLADSLEIDTLEFSVYSYGIGTIYIITSDGYTFATSSDEPYVVDEGYFRNLPYGTPVYLYKDNTLRGKFYTQEIKRIATTEFSVKCISSVGLLDKLMHNGGIYNGVSAGTIIQEIMGTVPYTIENDVSSILCYGWLPRATARANLTKVMFACGSSLLKAVDGSLVIRFNGYSTPTIVPDSVVYINGTVDNPQTVTKISLIEHSFIAAEDNIEEVLFDNTTDVAAVGSTIYFDEPYHSLRADGITIDSSGANYATLTGVGILYGKKYTHAQRELVRNINNEAEPNEINIKDATLVSAVNSNNVMERLESYYSNADIVNVSIVDTIKLKPGDYINLTDPFGESFDGVVQAVDETISDIDKANTTLIRNWTPSAFGNNYSNYILFTEDATWTIPTGVSNIRVFVAAGGSGGQSGANGARGAMSNGWGQSLNGGKGGLGGQGGDAGKVYAIDISVTPGDTGTITIGLGGSGGVAVDTTNINGAEGGETTFEYGGETYTSNNGAIPPYGIINTFSGERYSLPGNSGIDGGDGITFAYSTPAPTTVTDGITTWTSGSKGRGYIRTRNGEEYQSWGGMGGGPAIGANGGNGEDGSSSISRYTFEGEYYYYIDGGYGGDGANANPGDDAVTIGCGGNGGHGGGGAGGGGRGTSDGEPSHGYGGDGGTGGTGGTGANGYVLIYY